VLSRLTSPPSSPAASGVSPVNDVTWRVGSRTSHPGSVLLNALGYSPMIGVYDVVARWRGDRCLLVAGEASGHEVVGVHPGTLEPERTF
jgi:hypothetical protein